MGIKAFDFENDGDLDLYITDMHSDMSEHIGPEREKEKAAAAAEAKAAAEAEAEDAVRQSRQLKAKAARLAMSDFDRFKLMVAKKKRSAAVKKALKKKK